MGEQLSVFYTQDEVDAATEAAFNEGYRLGWDNGYDEGYAEAEQFELQRKETV